MREQFSKFKCNNLSKYTRKQVWNTTITGFDKKIGKNCPTAVFFPKSPSCQTMTEGVHIIIRYPVRKSNVTFPFQKYSKRKFSQKKMEPLPFLAPAALLLASLYLKKWPFFSYAQLSSNGFVLGSRLAKYTVPPAVTHAW